MYTYMSLETLFLSSLLRVPLQYVYVHVFKHLYLQYVYVYVYVYVFRDSLLIVVIESTFTRALTFDNVAQGVFG